MFRTKIAAIPFVAAVSAANVSQAQTSIPLYTVSYQVQVRWEMWRNGNTYWALEYETSDPMVAQLVYELFEAALEDGSLGDILGGGFDWIPREVRLHTKYSWNLRRTDFQRTTIQSSTSNYFP
jgi:hypothetical protein